MKTRFFLLALALTSILTSICSPDAAADPANPRPFRYTQPDGSIITLVLHGDEFGSWTTDTQGQVLQRGADGFYRPSGESPETVRRRVAARALRNREARSSAVPVKRASSVGYYRSLVLLIDFRDKRFTVSSPHDAFYNLLNQSGYSRSGAIGCAVDYYHDNSYGAFLPSFDVVGPITLDKSATDFPEGDSDEHFAFAEQSLREALAQADPEVDYSQYDMDGDGYVDNVFFFFAGESQSNGGGPDTIWPHAGGMSSVLLDGVRINHYGCASELVYSYSTYQPEMCGIGTFCHEFGHIIGLPDVYDTDYSDNGSALHPGNYSLMSGGNHNNGGHVPANLTAFEKSLLGWMEIPMLEEGTVSLPDLGTHPIAGYIPSDTPGEWFVFETRDGKGWDKSLDPGLLVIHLDRSENMAGNKTAAYRWEHGSKINAYADHPCYTPVLPSSSDQHTYVFPSNGVNAHTFFGWSGDQTGYVMKDVTYQNSTSQFNLDYQLKKVWGTVRDNNGDPVPDVTLSIAPQASVSASASRNGIRSSRVIAENAVYRTVSRSDGSYDLIFDDSGDTFEILVENDYYLPVTRTITFQEKNIQQSDFEIKRFVISGDVSLSKFDPTQKRSWGWDKNPLNYSAAVRFNADELEEHQGKLLASVDVLVSGDGNALQADAFYVLVEVDGARVFFHPVAVSGLRFNEWNRIDISDENFRIPAGKDVYIGYAVENIKSRYPMATDKGPMVDGGLYYYTGVSPEPYWWEGTHIESNLFLAVSLTSPSTVDGSITLLDLGIHYITPLPAVIRDGDTLSLSIVSNPSDVPAKVEWYCDGETCSESLIARQGTHTVRAVLTFNGQRSEIVETQFVAQ